MIKPSTTQARSAVALLVLAASTLVGIGVHEGYKDEAYVPVRGDVPTIGFGSTKDVKMGDKTTPVRSLQRLMDEIDSVYAQGVRKCIKVPLYQHEFSALVSFTYNVGVNAFCNSTLVKKMNAGDYAEGCAELSKWVYGPGKKKLQGLVNRRAEERKICEGRG